MKKLLKKTIEWDIKTQPLNALTDIKIHAKAIIRNDNNYVLGIVSSNYRPFTNRSLEKLCRSIEKTGPFKTEGFAEFKNGKVVMAFMRNQTPGLKLNGHDLREYFVVGNSHDGSKKLFIGTSHRLIRCENQFYSAIPLFTASHRGQFHITPEFILNLKSWYEIGRSDLYKKLELFGDKKINYSLIEQLINYLLNTDKSLPTEESKLEILNSKQGSLLQKSIQCETRSLGMNAFGLLNGVTWYTSHEMRSSKSNFGNASGLAMDMNTKAFAFCSNI